MSFIGAGTVVTVPDTSARNILEQPFIHINFLSTYRINSLMGHVQTMLLWNSLASKFNITFMTKFLHEERHFTDLR